MSTNYNPRIVSNGLVLAVDAGNNKSHSTNRFISYGSGLVTENVTFSIQGTGTFQRVAAGTVIGGYTVKVSDVVYSYALGGLGCHYHGNSIPIPAGVSATFTFDYLVTGATTYPQGDYLANFENALNAAIATANNLQNVWQRRSFSAGPTSVAGTLNAYLYPGACSSSRLADSGTIYYRNPRVEFSSVDTGTGNFRSMPNLTTWYDLTSTNNGTLVNGPYHLIGNNANGTAGYMSFDGTDDRIDCGTFSVSYLTVSTWVYKTSTASQQGICRKEVGWAVSQYLGTLQVAPGTSWTFYDTGYTIPLNTWVNIVYTYSGTGTTGSQTVYINGSSIYSTTAGSGPITANSNQVRIGYDDNNWFWGGRIAQTQIYNRALTAAEVRQNFNAQRSRFGV